MKFGDFVEAALFINADNRDDALTECLNELVRVDAIRREDVASIHYAMLKKEEFCSTGIGRGVAVPHTSYPSVDREVGAVAISHAGVEWKSLDGEPVHIVCTLVAPPDRPGDHLRAKECIARHLRDDTFCRFLRQSKAVDDIWLLLQEADNNQL